MITDAARTWYSTGALPLPVATDGTKRPAVNTWRNLQHHRPNADALARLHELEHDGIGVITGAISGNLEMVELEGVAVKEGILQRLSDAFADHGRSDLWARLAAGCTELTPSGGIHYYLRVTDGPALGNTKLARRPATSDELATNPSNRIRVLIETRGEGGFSVTAPSAGRTHPSGKPWVQIAGSPATIPTFTVEERDFIYDMCRLFDAMPDSAPVGHHHDARNTGDTRLRPGDDYNQRATWAEILTPHGWTLAHRQGRLCTWVRPGKHKRDGISATTGRNDADNLYVFSSSTDFTPEVPYSKFGAYALLEHGGDHSAAARALQASGYGDPAPVERHLALLPSDTTPQHLPAPAAPAVDGTTALAPVTQLHPAPTVIEDNEDALALAFVDHMADTLRYCPQRRQWLTWEGSRWEWDEAEKHREHVRVLARRLPRDTKTEAAFRRKMLSATGVSAIANLARTDARIVTHLNDLDNEPWELNTPAGVVDLHTGHITPPTPTKLHTRSTAVAPDFDTEPARWLEFLDVTFGGDRELIGYIQRLMGVAIIGQVLEQVMPFGHGVGANGKSVFVETCTDVLGRGERGYAIAAQAEMLMARKYQEHSTELAQLAGARLVVCSELEDGARFAEARVKQLTGRDSISARFMRRDFFTFTPSHTFLLVANHKPQATVGGPAFWRRLRLIPFNHVVPEAERDSMLPDKLRAEWPAILGWIIKGAADYAAGGIRTPSSVLAATQSYQRDEDTMARFVDEYCHLAPGSDLVRIATGRLRAAYEAMCKEMGDEPVSPRRFTQELRDRFGIGTSRTGSQRFLTGVTLLHDDEEEGDHDDRSDKGLL